MANNNSNSNSMNENSNNNLNSNDASNIRSTSLNSNKNNKNNDNNINDNVNNNKKNIRLGNTKNILNKTRKTLKSIIDKSIYYNIENSNDAVNFFTILIVVCYIIKFSFGNMTSLTGGEATITLWTYSIILLSMTCIIVLMSVIPQVQNTTTGGPGAYVALPLLMTVVAYIWCLTMNIKFYDKINSKTVPSEYYGWSTLSTLFLMIQTILLVIVVKMRFSFILSGDYKRGGEEGGGIVKIIFGNIFFISLIFIFLGIQQVILDKFSLDG